MKNLLIWGATGQSLVLDELFKKSEYKLVALFDKDIKVSSPLDVPLFHEESELFDFMAPLKEIHFVVAIGGAKGKDRLRVHNFLKERGLLSIRAIHSKAMIADDVIVGEGCQIMIGAVVATKTLLGTSVIVNSSASIDHECDIGDGAHIGPGVKMAGCIRIGEKSFIGTGAIIAPRVTIGSNTIIGAGSLVLKNIPDNVVAFGTPANVVRQNS